MSTLKSLACLDALGSAYRGDWSEMDGRTLRDQLQEAAVVIAKEARGENVTADVAGFMITNGICNCGSSWTSNCGCA
jgi:hypothetical protein